MTLLRRFLLPLLVGGLMFCLWVALVAETRSCTTGPLERGGGYCVDSPGLLSFVAAPSTSRTRRVGALVVCRCSGGGR